MKETNVVAVIKNKKIGPQQLYVQIYTYVPIKGEKVK